MRYENPLYMAEDAGAADLIAGGRLQLGISRGSPEQVIDGWRYFGYAPPEGMSDADMARRHTEVFLEVLRGEGFAQPNPQPDVSEPAGPAAPRAAFGGPARAHLVGRRLRTPPRQWAAKLGMNLQSSTLKIDESGKPFHVQQAEQIRVFREAWKEAGHTREPRVSVSRSIFALVDDRDRAYFGRGDESEDQIGFLGDNDARHLRPQLRRRAGRSRRAAQEGRSHRRGRHAAADRAQPARRRLQRPRHRGDPEARRAGLGWRSTRLTLRRTYLCWHAAPAEASAPDLSLHLSRHFLFNDAGARAHDWP